MLKKLKLKFIIISTLSMMLVLVIVLGSVNVITYTNAVSDIYATLEFVSERSERELSEKALLEWQKKKITPETQYETRYIIVDIDENGELVNYNDEHIAAIDEEEREMFLEPALSSRRMRGLYEYGGLNYAFLKTTKDNGYRKVVIMDCTRNISTVHFFVNFSCYIGTFSVLLTMLILSIFARKAVQPLVKNIEAQKQFITNASHELKTPLAVISANTEVIEMMGGKSEWTESTVKQVQRMSELISQLVVLSRLEERQDLVLSDVDMSAEAVSVTDSMQVVAETQGKKMECAIDENVHVNADEKGLHELISILVDNAVKYCDEGGCVTVSLHQKGRNAILVVANDYADGEGVDYKRFFDRFYREDQSHNQEKKGYGIGLSMADSLIRMFKGKIQVSYKKPVISFTVTL